MSSDRNTQIDDGNVNENVGRNVIHAQQVTIVENLVTDNSDVSNNKSTAKKRLAFAIAGSIEEVDQAKLKAIAALLQELSGDTSINGINSRPIAVYKGFSCKMSQKLIAVLKDILCPCLSRIYYALVVHLRIWYRFA